MAIILVLITSFAVSSAIFFRLLAKEKNQSGEIRGRFSHAQNEIEFLRSQKDKIAEKAEEKIEFLQEKILSFEKQNSLLKQEKQQLEQQKQEWSKDKETILFKLSEELIKKNNEQQHLISVNQQENIRKITENLFKNFENVTAKVVSLNDDVKKSADVINLTKQALLNPGGSGRASEITLENILKNSGLKEKQDLEAVGDYVLQSHFSGTVNALEQEAKRPDAIIFFPNDQIIIIDSKSSPHFLDLEMAKQNSDIEQEKILLVKIKDSFKRHLETLKRKDYGKSLFEELHGKNSSDYKIMNIMFLQTEKMLEIVRDIDKDFEQKAFEAGIIIATPIGLINFLSQARIVIDRVKQEKNVEVLKVEVRKLLDNIAMIFKESKELGKSIAKALNSHNKITKNLNRQVYSSIKNISDLGIESKKSGEIKLLEEYDETGEVSEDDSGS